VIVKYFIYYDEINQKVKRTPKRLKVVQNYYYMGQLTDVEYELLIEILFRAYGENDIMLEQFLLYFTELKEFSDRIDELIY
jgi:hypothetical protein